MHPPLRPGGGCGYGGWKVMVRGCVMCEGMANLIWVEDDDERVCDVLW